MPSDPALEEKFLQHVLFMEADGGQRPFDVLKGGGLDMAAPEKLDDLALGKKLWEIIGALAVRRFFLESTDLLSDRQLYTLLWKKVLREEASGFGMAVGNTHYDCLGSGSDEAITMQMRYYADDSEREEWLEDNPDFPMPPSEPRPADRDRLLPKPGVY